MADMGYGEFRAHQDYDRAMDANAGLEAENDRLRVRLAEVEAELRDVTARAVYDGNMDGARIGRLKLRLRQVEDLCSRREGPGIFTSPDGGRYVNVEAVMAAARREGPRCTCPAIHYPPVPDCPAHGTRATWDGPACSMCGGTGTALYRPPSGPVHGRCGACNGHGNEPS